VPGQPVETLIGVSAIGFGVVVVYGAYKNVNPLQILREAISTGKFPDISKLAKLFGSSGANAAIPGPDKSKIVDPIKAKDPALADKISKAIDAHAANPSTATEADLLTLMAEMNTKGYKAEAKALLDWVNAHPKSGLGRDVVPNPLGVSNVDSPSGNDNGTVQGVLPV
jgi:hypothetical protein